MKCKKRKYKDTVAAKLAMASTALKDHRRIKNETRIYRCHRCKAYHLTSQPYREKITA
jgi:hypothetical protein